MLVKDQLGREVSIPFPPRRIISLVPSQTELLYDLGLDTAVVGITKFCVHPERWFREKTRVGGTKKVDIEKVRLLAPDLIIANKEENEQEQVTALMEEFPVWVSDIHSLDDSLDMLSHVGGITDRHAEAAVLTEGIRQDFLTLSARAGQFPPIPAAYFIWREPWMVAGGDTFIHHMLQHCGLQNVFGHQARYPQVDAEAIRLSGARLVLLSSEPYPFKEKHVDELRAVIPSAHIVLVDGEMFSWYGSRLRYAPSYFNELLDHCLQQEPLTDLF
ncbi:ABC transporter substrate-binding protein [Chitinophaga pendula]|nr:cobalamin-binding protein [Chitinophaga sp. MD30]UCJ10229.1 ABC transporter substrate-binding protein [Chitinophaga pendula]